MSKEIIELLEDGVENGPLVDGVVTVWIKRSNYDQALALLKQSECKTFEVEVRHPLGSDGKVNHKRSYCYHCGTTVRNQKYCHCCGGKLQWPVCPDCQQPKEQEFTKRIRAYVAIGDAKDQMDGLPSHSIVKPLLEACGRLDEAKAREEDLAKLNENLVSSISEQAEIIKKIKDWATVDFNEELLKFIKGQGCLI